MNMTAKEIDYTKYSLSNPACSSNSAQLDFNAWDAIAEPPSSGIVRGVVSGGAAGGASGNLGAGAGRVVDSGLAPLWAALLDTRTACVRRMRLKVSTFLYTAALSPPGLRNFIDVGTSCNLITC